MTTTSERAALEALLILGPDDIDGLAWHPVPGLSGVHEKVLWQLGSYVQAMIRVDPGGVIPGRPHLAAHHHIWVVSGRARIAGRTLTAGSYLHVPPEVEHRIDDVGPEGCLLLQMHRPHPPREADRIARS